MKTGIMVAVAAILVFVVAGSFSSVRGEPQQEPPKKSRQPQTSPIPSDTKTHEQGGEPGIMDETVALDHMTVMMQVDSMMQRVNLLMGRTQSYSKSFGLLAVNHRGADKKEILMMQRMSDSMGMMAGEIKTSLQQYKEMLEDETISETGRMQAEVEGFRIILDGIARDIEKAVDTLQTLDEQLGQG